MVVLNRPSCRRCFDMILQEESLIIKLEEDDQSSFRCVCG